MMVALCDCYNISVVLSGQATVYYHSTINIYSSVFSTVQKFTMNTSVVQRATCPVSALSQLYKIQLITNTGTAWYWFGSRGKGHQAVHLGYVAGRRLKMHLLRVPRQRKDELGSFSGFYYTSSLVKQSRTESDWPAGLQTYENDPIGEISGCKAVYSP